MQDRAKSALIVCIPRQITDGVIAGQPPIEASY